MRNRGFTLIELVVVVAIVAILAALLYPTLARASEKARQTHCNSNLRQLWQAMRMYVDDNGGRYPVAYSTSDCDPWVYHSGLGASPWGPQPHELAIRVVLEPYVSTPELWHCPSDNGEIRLGNSPGGVGHHTSPYYVLGGSSYDWAAMENRFYHYHYVAGKTEAQVTEPSTAALMWDQTYFHYKQDAPVPLNTKPAFCNILFCDGHVRAMLYQDWLRAAYGRDS